MDRHSRCYTISIILCSCRNAYRAVLIELARSELLLLLLLWRLSYTREHLPPASTVQCLSSAADRGVITDPSSNHRAFGTASRVAYLASQTLISVVLPAGRPFICTPWPCLRQSLSADTGQLLRPHEPSASITFTELYYFTYLFAYFLTRIRVDDWSPATTRYPCPCDPLIIHHHHYHHYHHHHHHHHVL